MKKKILAFFMCIIMIFTLCACTKTQPQITENCKKPDNTVLTVHYIDVGQGDSILLESNGVYVLIDAGEVEYGATVCEYIKKLGANTIDYVIATHPHSDHIGGLTDVINNFECKNFITKESDQQTKTWMNVLLAVDNTDTNYIDAKVSDTYSFGEAQFEILGPYSDTYDNYNNYSVIVKVVCGDTSFLFTGDLESDAEKEMLENSSPLKSDVLKVGHHGSTTSSCNNFLDAVNPTYAVISCGAENEYGHPHKETLKKLNDRGVTIYRTDELSTVIAYSDKKEITFSYVNTEKTVEVATKAPTETTAKKETTTSSHKTTDNQDSTNGYVGNKNSKKFHSYDCEAVDNMKDKNKVYFDSRDEALNKGYTGCESCNP